MKLGLGLSIPGIAAQPAQKNFVELTGASGTYISTPDAAALDFTGDMELRVQVGGWAVTASQQAFLGKSTTGSGGTSYSLSIAANTGNLIFSCRSATTLYADMSTISLTSAVAPGTKVWIRATLDADNSSSQHVVSFWTSIDGLTWTQLGGSVTAADTVVIQNTATPFTIGALNFGTAQLMAGKFYAAQAWNGIDGSGGTVALDWSLLRDGRSGATTLLTATGQTLTLHGAATLGRD